MFILLPFDGDWPLFEEYPRERRAQRLLRCLSVPARHPRRKSLSPSHTTVSYLRSAARSLSGISALSVILMCSGHTSVQHLVMLQKPSPFSSCACADRLSRVSSGCISSSVWRIKYWGPENAFLFSS